MISRVYYKKGNLAAQIEVHQICVLAVLHRRTSGTCETDRRTGPVIGPNVRAVLPPLRRACVEAQRFEKEPRAVRNSQRRANQEEHYVRQVRLWRSRHG